MSFRSSFRGALLGTGLGDGIGRSIEGGGVMEIEEVKDLSRSIDTFRYSDDTQQMMALADSLAENGRFVSDDFAEKLAEYFDRSRGYGPGSIKVIRSIAEGKGWREVAENLYGGEGSYGNGSSMRVAPIGLFCKDRLGDLRELAERSSRVTHTHELGREGAVMQAAAVALAARRSPSSELGTPDFLKELKSFLKVEKYFEKAESIEDLIGSLPDRSKVIKILGNGFEAPKSVPTAIFSFLSHTGSFDRAVLYAVSLGGDADTIGAMTGAISGAYHGEEGIPNEWISKMEDSDYLLELSDALFDASS